MGVREFLSETNVFRSIRVKSRLTEWLNVRGMSVLELARASGISYRRIREMLDWIDGKVRISEVAALADALGVCWFELYDVDIDYPEQG